MEENKKKSSSVLLNKWKILNGLIFILSAVATPVGLIVWMFWAHGWKIALAGVIATIWCIIFYKWIEKIEELLNVRADKDAVQE